MADARPRVVVVTTAWSGPGESAYLVRRVAAALAMTAEVVVVAAEGHRGLVDEHADGAFGVIRVPSPAPDLRRADLLQAALTEAIRPGGTATAIPAPVRAELRRLAGSADDGLDQLLGSLRPDAVVVAGHRHALAVDRLYRSTPRTALLALAVDDLALELSMADGGGAGWDAILATNAYEAALLRRSLDEPDTALVHDLAVALEGPCAKGRNLAGWIEDDNWLVVLDDPSSGFPAVAYLGLRFPTLTLVVLGAGATTVVRGRRCRVEAPVDRTAVWALMAGAVTTLDLRPAQVLAREVLESLLLSTPVIVPAASGAGRRCAEAGDGGLWYRDGPELAACVARMLDRDTRDTLGTQGRSWAAHRHCDQETFVDATTRAVLGGG